MRNALLFTTLGLLSQFALTTAQADSNYEIAARYAPVVYHETSTHPRADIFTVFDYDGDWNASNNWDHLDETPVLANVYYSVIETSSHYFIFYGFFHPRDYANACMAYVCHENDFEGLGVTVRKASGTSPDQVEYFETKAHSGMHSAFPPPLSRAPLDSPELPAHRPVVRVAGGGHAVYPWTKAIPAPGEIPSKTFVFTYAGHADEPGNVNEGAFGYELVPVETTVWAQRENVGKDGVYSDVFDFRGSRYSLTRVPRRITGSKWTSNAVIPPWAWSDGGKGNLERGDWFFDPAFAISRRIPVLTEPFSLDYVFNPYVGPASN